MVHGSKAIFIKARNHVVKKGVGKGIAVFAVHVKGYDPAFPVIGQAFREQCVIRIVHYTIAARVCHQVVMEKSRILGGDLCACDHIGDVFRAVDHGVGCFLLIGDTQVSAGEDIYILAGERVPRVFGDDSFFYAYGDVFIMPVFAVFLHYAGEGSECQRDIVEFAPVF